MNQPLDSLEDLILASLNPRATRERFGLPHPLSKFAANGGVKEGPFADAILQFIHDSTLEEPESVKCNGAEWFLLESEKAFFVACSEAGIDADRIVVIEDGQTVELDHESMRRGDKIDTGLVFVDGLGVGDVEQAVLRDRRHLAEDGILVVTLVLDRDTATVRAGPDLVSRGVIEPELSAKLMADARRAVMDSIGRFADTHADANLLNEAIHDAVSRTVYKQTRRRPMVIPVITEI